MLLLLVIPSLARAQGGNYANIVFGPTGSPKGGASITVCSNSATVTNGICFPAENDSSCCFTDATLTVHLATNPFTADGLGNFSFWASTGTYQVSFSGAGITAKTITVSVTGNPLLLNNTFSGSNTFSQQIISTVSTGTAPFSIASTTVVPNLNSQLHNGLTAPASAIVGISDSQTLTNKTIDCTANTLAKNPCIVYATASASTNSSIAATTMATA